jgi:hypothetical protein
MSGSKLAVGFSAEDKVSRVDKVEVWVTTDYGRKWTKYAEESKSAGKVIFEAKEEGIYEFATVGIDEIGNREKQLDDATRPDFRVVIDRTPPTIEVQGFKEGIPVSQAAAVELSWKAEDLYLADSSVEFEVSFKKEGAWRKLASGLPAAGKRKFELPVAQDDVLALRLTAKDLAGNVGIVAVGNVAYDQLPPEATLSGPEVAKDLMIKIGANVVDQGAAGVASATLWVADGSSRTWSKLCDLPVKPGEVEIRLPGTGTFGLAVSAVDAAGNQLATPKRGQKPLLTVSTDTVAPKLEAPGWVEKGQVVSARDGVKIRWKATDDNMGGQPVALFFSDNGGAAWAEASAAGLPAEGSLDWKPSNQVDSRQCQLRLVATDRLGNKSEAVSPLFTVDNSAPSSKATLQPIDDAAPVGPAREPAKAPEPAKEPVKEPAKAPAKKARK